MNVANGHFIEAIFLFYHKYLVELKWQVYDAIGQHDDAEENEAIYDRIVRDAVRDAVYPGEAFEIKEGQRDYEREQSGEGRDTVIVFSIGLCLFKFRIIIDIAQLGWYGLVPAFHIEVRKHCRKEILDEDKSNNDI